MSHCRCAITRSQVHISTAYAHFTMATLNALNLRSNIHTRSGTYNITPLPAEVQIVAPALLQLNRGTGPDHRTTYDTCPSSCPAIPTIPLPNCTECQATATESCFNLHCKDCYAHCASPCDDDNCDIPEICFDEHCATDVCPDTKCPADPCVGVTCTDVLHCDATCFDESCAWPPNQLYSFDPQLCLQGQCDGFCPSTSGFGNFNFNQGHSINDHFIQYAPDLSSSWNPPMHQQGHHYLQNDHINTNSSHKRRKTASSEIDLSENFNFQYPATQSYQSWNNHGAQNYGNPSMNTNSNLQQANTLSNQTWHTSHFGLSAPTNSTSFPGMSDQQESYGLVNNSSAIDGLICGLSHVAAEELDPTFKHSPFCGSVNKKRNRPRPDRAENEQIPPTTPMLPTPTNSSSNSSSPPQQSLCSPKFENIKGDTEEKEGDLTCRWMADASHDEDCGKRCGLIFASSKELDAHVQSDHTNKLGPQQFVCKWEGCNTTFKHRGKLNRHVSGAHSHCR